MKNLIIAPHGDDEVLGLGGLMASKIAEGEHFYVVYAAVGSTREDFTREGEIESVVDFLGIQRTKIIYRGYDGRLDTIHNIELISKLDKIINGYRPDRVFLPYKSHHQDHVKVHDCGLAACRISENYSVPFVALYEYPFVGQSIVQVEGGRMYYDITATIEKKIEAFYMYSSQVKKRPSPLNLEGIKALANIRGLESGCRYAEMFYIQRMVL